MIANLSNALKNGTTKIIRLSLSLSVRLAHYNQLHNNRVNLNQEAGQSVNEYLAVLQPIWTQLDQAKISEDHLHLIKVLMGLRPEYESNLFTTWSIKHFLKPPRPRSYSTRAKNFTKPRNSSVVAATSDNPTTPQFQISDLQSLLNQLISSSSSALAVSPSNRWLLDSACCNHMTSNYSLMKTPSPAKSLPSIYAADANYPQTGQTIGTGRKVGRLFELLSLQVPPPSSISAPVTDSDTYQWHLRLGHASLEKLHHLISINHLNNTTKALLFSAPAPTILNKMDVLSANIATFLTQYVPSFFLPHALRNFGVKQLLHPSLLSIVFLPPFFRTSLHSKDYMVLLPTILILKPSVVLALFSCILMNTVNLNHMPTSVVFLAMAQNIKHTMFSRLSSFHASFSSPQSFFTDTSIDLFPLSESPLGNELAQSAPTSATSDQSSISDGSPEPTPDTPPRQASTDPLWQKAMNDELQALEKTYTWDYVDLLPGKRPIGYKWIYKIKTHSDGTIEHYKARLVAKGYSQEYGIDYEETFAPVAQMTSVRSQFISCCCC
ncbi:retrotransposon protein [Cucumis melo var. makuwa]|uniref:Retrotransposon protein n=1 Tax=Cucumis melo var. makuwa TaxID=1194695 RepID=A0A5A7UES9_CUCMM|nr:retrotransposon protein [Cucumis melo var. makuwa]